MYQGKILWTEPAGEFSYPRDKYWYVPTTGGTPALLDPNNNPIGQCCVGIARPSGSYIYSLSPSRIARLFINGNDTEALITIPSQVSLNFAVDNTSMFWNQNNTIIKATREGVVQGSVNSPVTLDGLDSFQIAGNGELFFLASGTSTGRS